MTDDLDAPQALEEHHRPQPRQVARSIRALLPLAADQKWRILLLVSLGLLMSLLEGLGLSLAILFVYMMLGEAGDMGDEPSALGPVLDWLSVILNNDPVRIGTLAALTVIGSAILAALYGILSERIANLIADRTRVAIFEQYLKTNYDYIRQKGRSALIDVIEFEATFVPPTILSLAGIMGSFITVIIYSALIAFMSWQLGLTLMVLGGVMVLGSLLPGDLLGRMSAKVSRFNEILVARAVGGIQAMRTIHTHGVEDAFAAAFARASRQFADAQVTLASTEFMLLPLRSLGLMVVFAGFLYEAHRLHAASATVLGVVALAYRVAPTVSAIMNFITSTLGLAGPLGLVADALATANKTYPSQGTVPFRIPFNRLEFQSVYYTYWDGDAPVLRDVSFRLERRSSLALTGMSGSGKTTIVNLLARLCEPGSGSILLDSTPLSDIRRDDWFRRVAFAGQDLELISGTIADNVRFARPGIGDADIRRAMKMADILDFVESLPLGVRTKVGDYGHRLSGGQRQRIGLARALAGNPAILILDESTNAIDVGSEASIFRQLRTQMPDLTLIVITHRSNFEGFDQVLRLAEGVIVEARLPLFGKIDDKTEPEPEPEPENGSQT